MAVSKGVVSHRRSSAAFELKHIRGNLLHFSQNTQNENEEKTHFFNVQKCPSMRRTELWMTMTLKWYSLHPQRIVWSMIR